MSTRLIIVRHGETQWNVEGRYQGQQDPPLNKNGLDQARELARIIPQAGIDLLYSSELRRASETAEILARALNVPLHRDARLNEINQGEWETLLKQEIAERYPETFGRWDTEPWTVTIPGGENLQQVRARVFEAIDEILEKHRGKCIGVVAHRIPIALLKIRYQGVDPALVRKLKLPNTFWEEMPIPGTSEVQDL